MEVFRGHLDMGFLNALVLVTSRCAMDIEPIYIISCSTVLFLHRVAYDNPQMCA